MISIEQAKVESEAMSDFAQVMQLSDCSPLRPFRTGNDRATRISLDEGNVKNGLGRLVLTLVKVLHELLERQAIQRVDGGSLDPDQIEKLGVTLMRQAREIERLRKEFGLEERDLNLDLGPLGTLL